VKIRIVHQNFLRAFSLSSKSVIVLVLLWSSSGAGFTKFSGREKLGPADGYPLFCGARNEGGGTKLLF
jgi:preprotein translocase subunit SecG